MMRRQEHKPLTAEGTVVRADFAEKFQFFAMARAVSRT
jgi:hypothetical protein